MADEGCSQRFFTSTVCGNEWHTFSYREIHPDFDVMFKTEWVMWVLIIQVTICSFIIEINDH